jgi:nucleoid-associated protein YgaU
VVNAHGNPVRIEVGVTLKLYTRDEVLAERSAANRRAAARGVSAADRSRRGSYTVRQGDTLMSIARKELGDGDRWKEIADLNDVNDPRKVKVGTRLRMPTTKAKR